MRSGKLLFVLGFLMVAGLLLGLTGCSSDSTSSVVLENPRYLAVKAQVNAYVDSTLNMSANAMEMVLTANAGDTTAPISYGSFNPDSVINTGEWCLVYLGDVQTAFTNFYLDSIQFTKGGLTNSQPIGAETMNLHHTWRYNSADTTGVFKNYTSTATLTISGLKTDQAVVDGTATHAVDYRETKNSASIRGHVNFEATMTGLTFTKANNGWTNGIPSSGQVATVVTMIYQSGTQAPDTTSWSVDASFTDGTMTATVVSDGATKTYTRTIQ
jgi:hypothetical protein